MKWFKRCITVGTLVSLILSGLVVSASSLTISDKLSNQTISASSNHTIAFGARTAVSSGTIKMYFRNAVSSMGAIDHTDIDLTYGATSASLAASAGAGTWGVSVDTTNKIITFTYPTSGGTPIAVDDSVEIKIGSNATFQATGDVQLVNATTTGSKMGSLVAGSDVGLFSVALVTNAQASTSASKASTTEGGTVVIAPTPAPTPAPAPAPAPTPTPAPTTPTPAPAPAPQPAPTTPAPAPAPQPAPTTPAPAPPSLQPTSPPQAEPTPPPPPPAGIAPSSPSFPSSLSEGAARKINIKLPEATSDEISPTEGKAISVKRSDGAGVEIRVPQQIIIESKIIEKSSEIKVGLPISQEEKKKRINIEREIIKKELIEPKIEKKKTTEEVEKAIRLLPETQSKDIYIEGAHIEILQSNMKLEEVIVIAKENNDIKKIIVGPNISHNEVIDFVAEKETSIHEYVQQKVLERVEEKFQEEEIDVTEQLRIQESVVEEIKKIELIRKTESRSKDEIYLIVSALPENSFDVYIQEKKISRTTPETDLSEAIVVVKKDTIIQNIFSSSTLSVERVVDVVLRKDISLRKEIQEKAKVRIEKIGDEEHNEEEQDTQRQKEDVIKKLKEEIRQKFEEKTSSETIKTLVRENDLQDVELYISGKKEVVTDQTNFTESILVLKEKNTKNIRKIVASIDINRDEFIELLISSDDDIKNKIQRIVETRIEKSADIEKKVNKDQRVYLESPQEIDLLKPEKIEEPIQLDVKPLTPDQAISWAGLKVPFGKRHMRGHLYLVTASRRIADIQVPISRFPNPLQYTFQYSDDDLIGVSEESLQVYSWDPEIGQPQLENSIVDPETNTIFASIDHLTIFTLAGQAISAGGAGSVGSTGLMEAVVEPEVTYIASVELEPTQTQVKGDDLGLFQTETDQKATFAANEFYTTPNTEFSLCIPLKLFKKPVKRVHLDVAGKKIPLKLDTKKGCYAASVKMSEKKGKQSIIVTIVYADGQIQTLKFQAVVTGKFQSEVLSVVAPAVQQVKEVAIIVNTQVQKTVEATQPVLQATAVVTAPIITVASPSVLTNTMNIWHYASHLFSSLITALGLRRRRKPWGVVYNAISKTPIDLAILRLFNASNNKLLETQVTDKNGRFSFLAPPGEYSITVTKPPFIYPSALVKTSTDGDYAHVYRRELLKITKPDEAIDLSIPLDPPSGEKGGTHEKETLLQQLKKIFSKYSTVYLILSLVVSFALAIYVPTTTNALLLIFNGVFTIIQVYLTQRVEKSWGVVFDMESGQQIPLAAISIIDALQNKLLRTRLTDYHGRFSFLPPPGEYILTVSKDQYLFPPITQKKSSKYKDVYIGGKLVIKKKKGFAKANIPMEKKAVVPTPPPQAPLPPSQALPVVPTTESPQQLEQKPPTTPT